MRIIYRYLLKEIVTASFASIAVLTALLMLGDTFKKVSRLTDTDVPAWLMLKIMLLLSPQAMTITIPWGLLVGTLLVFGRMSNQRELLIIRSAGIGLVPLIAPVALFSLFMCAVSFYNNAMLAPRCTAAVKAVIYELGHSNPTLLIKEKQPVDQFEGNIIYVEKKHGNTIEGVHIWKLDSKTKIPVRSIRAERGVITVDWEAKKLEITLYNAWEATRATADPADLSRVQIGMRAGQAPHRVDLGDGFDTNRLPLTIGLMTAEQIMNNIFASGERKFRFTPLFTELQKRVSFSVACFTFMFLAIPLAINTGRGETSVGFVISVAVVMLYYLMIVYAMSLRENPNAYPDLIIWIPNLLLQTAALWLVWRANRHPA